MAPHRKGRMVDGDNALEGDGAFSASRSGGLPVGDLVRLCFSGKYSYSQIYRMINSEGGLFAYLGESDIRVVQKMAETDEKARLCLDAMVYQTCKAIGACATVLKGEVDAILLTGAVIYSRTIVEKIKESCGFIADVVSYPGENEMESLAMGALECLRNPEKILDFVTCANIGEAIENKYKFPFINRH